VWPPPSLLTVSPPWSCVSDAELSGELIEVVRLILAETLKRLLEPQSDEEALQTLRAERAALTTFACTELTTLQRVRSAARRRLDSTSARAIREGVSSLQEVHLAHFGPIVEGRSLHFDGDAFLRQCQRDSPVVTRLWRSFVTPHDGRAKGGWRRKFLRSIFVQGAIFRIARTHEPLARTPTAVLYASMHELFGASRNVARLNASVGLAPYPDLMDAFTDRQHEVAAQVMLTALVDVENGRAAQIQRSGAWLPQQASMTGVFELGRSASSRSALSRSASAAMHRRISRSAKPTTSTGAKPAPPRPSTNARVPSELRSNAPAARAPSKRVVRRSTLLSPLVAADAGDAPQDPMVVDGGNSSSPVKPRRMSFGIGMQGAAAAASDGASSARGSTHSCTPEAMSSPDTVPLFDRRLLSCVMLYTDNGNRTQRTTTHRFFRQLGVNAVAIGGLIFPMCKIDPSLSSELPAFVRSGRDATREVATDGQLRRLLGVAPSDDHTALRALAAANGWHAFDRQLSRLPMDVFHVRRGHFSLEALPAGASKPLGRQRFEVLSSHERPSPPNHMTCLSRAPPSNHSMSLPSAAFSLLVRRHALSRASPPTRPSVCVLRAIRCCDAC
jgi:hypothetical protein